MVSLLGWIKRVVQDYKTAPTAVKEATVRPARITRRGTQGMSEQTEIEARWPKSACTCGYFAPASAGEQITPEEAHKLEMALVNSWREYGDPEHPLRLKLRRLVALHPESSP